MPVAEQSVYVPAANTTPPIPKWKQMPEFREVLPPDDESLHER